MQTAHYTEEELTTLPRLLPQLRQAIGQAVVGQQEVVDQLLVTLLAGGHALLEGVPGLAKTLMVRSLAQALHLKFRRIQFTPDLMPGDLIGTEILEEDRQTGHHHFIFNQGPLFANIVLADEINRTPPKTQAALLEAMQESNITWSGKTYELEQPYLILATQNPLEQAGTFPLPEAQLDRFLLYIRLGYPSMQEEVEILSRTTSNEKAAIEPVMGSEEIIRLRRMVRDLPVSPELLGWVAGLVQSTRPEQSRSAFVKEWVSWGAGPRAGQALVLAAKAHALMHNRLSVIPEDLAWAAKPVLRHRILLNFGAEAEGITPDSVVERLLQEEGRR
ncbi:moxR protein [Flammeovirgaceae bacterium 311]|nr:moxR protein [Flammeovirgaceae bacterium 311]